MVQTVFLAIDQIWDGTWYYNESRVARLSRAMQKMSLVCPVTETKLIVLHCLMPFCNISHINASCNLTYHAVLLFFIYIFYIIAVGMLLRPRCPKLDALHCSYQKWEAVRCPRSVRDLLTTNMYCVKHSAFIYLCAVYLQSLQLKSLYSNKL